MEEIIQKIRELMAQVAPSIDTSPGSAFDAVVLQYIRDNFGVGDLDLDVEDMIRRRITQLDQNIAVDEGSAVYELLIKPLSAVLQVPRLEVQRLKLTQDLNNLDQMTDAEVDRRLSNFGITRRIGDVAIGRVRLYFASPVPVNLTLDNRAVTADGKGYFPDGNFTASQNLVASNQENGLYYIDAPYVAEAPGDAYNIGPNEIVTVENLPGLVRATNPDKFVGGVPPETNEAFLARAKKSLAERSLGSRNSIITVITEQFLNQVLSVVAIGFGDPEMSRDSFIVKPSAELSAISLEAFVKSTSGSETFTFSVPDVDPTSLLVYHISSGAATQLTAGVDYTFVDGGNVLANDRISVNVGSAGDTIVVQYVRISGYTNLIATLPGGIETPPLFPAPPQEQTVHVGGKADIYVKPSVREEDSLIIRRLSDFTAFKAADGRIYQDTDGLWYLEFSRGLPLNEVGALVGDLVDVVTQDAFGDPAVLQGDTVEIVSVDLQNRRYVLSAQPYTLQKLGTTDLSGLDIRIRLPEKNAVPLERLVARDNSGDPIFLDTNGNYTSEYDPANNLPLAPSMGYVIRDASLPEYPKTFQHSLPMVATEATTFKTRATKRSFLEGVDSVVGDIEYFVAEENIASKPINTPWTRILNVSVLNPLSLAPIVGRTAAHIYPVSIRARDLSGGVNPDLGGGGLGANPSGTLRIYYEKPVTLLMYGPAYQPADTKFTARIRKEVSPGVFVDFNLIYRLLSHGPAGNPAILVLPSDFQEENGLYYIDVFVEGDPALSTRSDGEPVRPQDMNLPDDQELFVGPTSLADPLYHIVDELEFEQAGNPQPKTLGDSSSGFESTSGATYPYLNYTVSEVGGLYRILGPAPDLISNGIRAGDVVRILKSEPTPFLTDTFVRLDDYKIRSDPSQPGGAKDYAVEGVIVGTRVVIDSVEYLVTTITGGSNDVLELQGPSPVSNTVTTADFYKWAASSNHEVLETVSATDLRVTSPIPSLTGARFVILDPLGEFRLKNPHVRLGLYETEDGTPGNDPNEAFRAEGYWFSTRNPFDRSLVDGTYSYSVEELTYFRFTDGHATEYSPVEDPLGNEFRLQQPTKGLILGARRDDFTFFCGGRVPVKGSDFELMVGTTSAFRETFSSTTATSFTLPDTVGEGSSADINRTRVFASDGTELRQIPYDATALPLTDDTVYMFEDTVTGPKVIHVSAANASAGISVEWLVRVDEVYIVDSSPDSISLADHKLTMVYPVTTSPKTAAELAKFINDSPLPVYAIVGAKDIGGTVAPTGLSGPPYRRSVTKVDSVAETFSSQPLKGQDIQIDYEWSQVAQDVHNFVTSPLKRSIDQDLLVRHGIPVYVNVDMEVASSFLSSKELEDEVKNYILVLDQEPLRVSDLVRIPTIAKHIPLPITVVGIKFDEYRRVFGYIGQDGIEYRRVEVVIPNTVVAKVLTT